jgi:hypothetical protein
MLVLDLIWEAEKSALATIHKLAVVQQEMSDTEFEEEDGFLGTPLPSIITFYVQFCPIIEDWQLPIGMVLSPMRGVRPSRGFKFAGRRHGCAHEAVLASVKELQGWLGRQGAFYPIASYLLNKHLRLFRHAACFWHEAVVRFLMAKGVDDSRAAREARQYADDAIYEKPHWKDCNTIYAQLVGEDTFCQRTFTQTIRANQPRVYRELANELGKKASQFDLDTLRRQVQWEAARALFLSRSATQKQPTGAESTAEGEEWLPAKEAVERAQQAGFQVRLSWLSRSAAKRGVKTRPRQLSGKHQLEVEWKSLAGYLVRKKAERVGVEEPCDGDIGPRIEEASAKKRRARPLD